MSEESCGVTVFDMRRLYTIIKKISSTVSALDFDTLVHYPIHMNDLEIFLRLLMAVGFGAVLGLETETRTSEEDKSTGHAKPDSRESSILMRYRLGGVRTYIVLSLFGAVGGLLFTAGQPVFGYLVFAAILLLVLSAYILNVWYQRAFGITTEIAILIATLVGFLATTNLVSLQILVVVIVILTFVLSQKQGVGMIVRRIAHEELSDIVKFTILVVVILPFLPNQDVYLRDFSFIANAIANGQLGDRIGEIAIINPFRLWEYVVLISGFSMLGYFATKIWGKTRGLVFTGVFGGFVSSTTMILSMAGKSKQLGNKASNALAGAGLLSHGVSFLQIGVLALSTSFVFFDSSFSVLFTMSMSALIIGLLLIWRNRHETKFEVEHHPFSLNLAVKFALLLSIVKLLIQITNISLPPTAFVIVTAISGVAGMDVATIALGELVGLKLINPDLALFTFVMTNAVNFVAKAVYARLSGSKQFAKVIEIAMAVGILLTLVVWWLQVSG